MTQPEVSPALLKLVTRAYSALVRLYPASFRRAYGEEMQAVFAECADHAAREGTLDLGVVVARELLGLPGAALRTHVEAHRAREWFSSPTAGESLSLRESLVALAVFIIPAGLIALNVAPSALVGRVVPPAMLALLLLGTLAGVVRRFPRWSIPYFGLVLAAVVFLFLFQWEAERLALRLASRVVIQPREALGRLLLVTFWEGVVWLSLLALVVLVLYLARSLPVLRALARRLQQDWTQVSYLLYSGSMLALVLAFDGYRNGAPYAVLSLACLAAGAWGYLRSREPGRGFLALLVGATLSMWVAAAGKWLIAPDQDWTAWIPGGSFGSERWFEAERALVAWGWMLVVMALPGLFLRLSRDRPPDSPEPV